MGHTALLLRDLHFWYVNVCCVGSYVACGLTLTFTFVGQSKIKKQYRFIIGFSAAIDAIFTLFTHCSMMVIEHIANVVFIVTDQPFLRQQSEWGQLFAAGYVFFLCLMTVVVPINFLYRYCIVCHQRTLRLRELLLVYGVGVGVCALTCTAFNGHARDRAVYNVMLRSSLLFGADRTLPPYGAFDTSADSSDYIFTAIASINIASYAITITCNYLIVRETRSCNANLHRRTMKAQEDFIRVLQVQAFLPIATLFVPFAICCGTPWLGAATLSYAGVLLTTSISTIPFLNELCVLALLPNYSRRFKKLWARNRIFTNTATEVSTSNVKTSEARTKI